MIRYRENDKPVSTWKAPAELSPTYFTDELVNQIAPIGGLNLNGRVLLIQEGREFQFIREWPEFTCPQCFAPVKVQVFIFPDTPFDTEFFKHDWENPQLEAKPFGTIWYFAKEEKGRIFKQCACDWKAWSERNKKK